MLDGFVADEVEDDGLPVGEVDLILRAVLCHVLDRAGAADAVDICSAVVILRCYTGHASLSDFHSGNCGSGAGSGSGIARRGGVAAGNFRTQKQEAKLGVINKDVTHAGDRLDSVVSAHLPSVNGVFLHPLQEDGSAFHNAGGIEHFAGIAPAHHVLQHQTRHIAVEIKRAVAR